MSGRPSCDLDDAEVAVTVPDLPDELQLPLAAAGLDRRAPPASGIRGLEAGCGVVNDPAEEEEEEQVFPLHREWSDRFRKTLYYGGCGEQDLPSTDRFSLSLTEMCVEEFEGATADGEGLMRTGGLMREETEEEDQDQEGWGEEEEEDRAKEERRKRRLKRQRQRWRRRRRRATLDRMDVSRTAELSKNTQASPASLVVALLYLERLRTTNPNYLDTVSSTDLFLVTLMVASKFLNDDGEDDEVFNDEWAEAGGMELKDLNRKELEFLEAIGWSVYVSNDDFRVMLQRVEASVARRQMVRRTSAVLSCKSPPSVATYTDLSVLLRCISPLRIWQLVGECTFKVTAVCATAYAASVMAMLGTVCFLHESPMAPTSVHQAISQAFFRQQQQLSPHQQTLAATLAMMARKNGTVAAAGADEPMQEQTSTTDDVPDSLDSSDDSTTSFVLASLAAASAAAASSMKGSRNETASKRLDSSGVPDYASASPGADDVVDSAALLNDSASSIAGMLGDPGGGGGGGWNHHGTTVLLAPVGGKGEQDEGVKRESKEFIIADAWNKILELDGMNVRQPSEVEPGISRCPLFATSSERDQGLVGTFSANIWNQYKDSSAIAVGCF